MTQGNRDLRGVDREHAVGSLVGEGWKDVIWGTEDRGIQWMKIALLEKGPHALHTPVIPGRPRQEDCKLNSHLGNLKINLSQKMKKTGDIDQW